MESYGVNVQRFKVAENAKDAGVQAQELLNTIASELVVKAQILAGGRGKGKFSSGLQGGVHLTTKADEVSSLIKKMLGHTLTTKQTGKDGVIVKKVMIAEALDIERETYFAILMDRTFDGPVMVGSPAGGVDIEEVAKNSPDLIFKKPIDITVGITEDMALDMAANLDFDAEKRTEAARQIQNLYKLFIGVDATQVEINPFGETPDGRVVCFDAKMNFDDNSEFRQKQVFSMDDESETDPRETRAAACGLNYVGMDGNIGCLVNGAGLAMATMDIIDLYGGHPANFLDVGGGVQEHQVVEAIDIITSDPQVKAILINIFGGIVNCATVANGLITALQGIKLEVPLVVRLAGTNVDAARQILDNSNLPIVSASDLDDAAQKAVEMLMSESQ
ncbi:succinate--CoA ligase [GDP-forming] subunit beta, mitochondrial-like [Saccoglossus kowalevskii]|uniref:Succinate--CoA ligase [GDP-forming] subunit beta, mitochondrial n=1 Tax=Saccoglossus kowalevskii TaxID=10224 RepID=A0ABM0GW75_SACKO|nr:PREDICTED: succinyl-CoA ligase [GDP-forming] subunit beta, mitochondrial-like [Saccoglossus kowalevskii]